MKQVAFKWVSMALLMLLCGSIKVYAQFNIQHQAPTVIVKGEETSLEFLLPGISQDQISEAILFSRTDGQISFQQQEAFFRNGVFFTSLTVSDDAASTLEYYFNVLLLDGTEITFPENNPVEEPIQVPVVGGTETVEDFEPLTGVDFTILSPEEGVAYDPEDVVLAIALFYDPLTLEPGEFRVMFDGRDVTSDADTSAFLISYAPKKVRTGAHTLAIDYVSESTRYRLTSWAFRVVDADQARFTGFGERNLPVGSVELTARNQVIAGNTNDALTGRVRVSGNQGLLKYSLNGFLTSQEDSRLQPQNRLGLNLQLGKWWNLDAGHIYPRVSNLSLNGRRVYGLNTELSLINEGFNVQFIYGEMNRRVTNDYSELVREEVFVDGNPIPVDTTYTLNFSDGGRGTFTREIIGGRVAFGNERKFQWGIHAMKIEDDTNSIDQIGDFNDLLSLQPTLSDNASLNAGDLNKLGAAPDLLRVSGGNPNARGNFVAGTDLRFNLDRNRIRFDSEVSAGVVNNDIRGGALTVERADELGFELDQDDEDLLDRLSRFIIINENLSNLPLRIEEDEFGDNTTEFFFPTAILAGNSNANFNYFNNNLRIQYRWIGPDYTSLANNTVRRDVAGFTITDRIRLVQDRVFLTLGYESLDDNVVGNREATTTTNTVRTNVSWYPIQRLLPRVSIGFRFRNRDNAVDRFNPNISGSQLNAAVQNFRIVNGDTLGATTARSNNTFAFNSSVSKQFDAFDSRHDASLNVSTLNTTDDVFVFGDTRSTSISLNLNSRFSQLPLNTVFGFSINNTETTSGLSEFKIFGIYVGGNYFLMDNKLSINGRLAATSNRTRIRSLEIDDNGTPDNSSDDFYVASTASATTDEFGTFVLRAGAQYDIDPRQALIFESNFTSVSATGASNDRIVQLRYVFRF